MVVLNMTLPDYIRHFGPEKFAKSIGVKKRTVISWMYLARYPKKETAKRIVERHPINMDGIYGS
jgi:hypothetical protein